MLYVYNSTYKSRWSETQHKPRAENLRYYDVVIPNEIWDEIFNCVNPKELFALSCVNKNFNDILSGDNLWKNAVYGRLHWSDTLLYDESKMVGLWKAATKMLVYQLVIYGKDCQYFVNGDDNISIICYLVNRRKFHDLKLSMLIKSGETDHVTYKIDYRKIITFNSGVRHKIKVTSTTSNPTIQFKAEDITLLQLLIGIGCFSSLCKIEIL
jgi:hypothetical protein